MPKKRFSAEQIVTLLRQIEVLMAQGKAKVHRCEKSILVDIREVVEISLSLDPGITLMSCASGADALLTAAEWKPDVILLDVMMPGMDGPQTLTHLRENKGTASIPVVFMTARAQNREVEHFLSLGAVGVIPKPFDPMTLATALRAYLPAEQPLH